MRDAQRTNSGPRGSATLAELLTNVDDLLEWHRGGFVDHDFNGDGSHDDGGCALCHSAWTVALIEALLAEIEELKVRDIVSRNPGIDVDKVREYRRTGIAP